MIVSRSLSIDVSSDVGASHLSVHPIAREHQPPLSKVAVIIPALNEAEALPKVLADLPRVGLVIVVDNGSEDETAEVARDWGATVVREPERGYGAACLGGLATLHSIVGSQGESVRQHGVVEEIEVVAFLDADYGDHPDRLPEIVMPILNNEVDFVLGSRILGKREPGSMPLQAVVGNRLACFLMKRIWGVRYTDLGPMRAMRYSVLKRLEMADRNFGWTVEMQIKAAREKVTFREIPVPYRRRVGVSKISGTLSGTIKAGYKILYTIYRYGRRG
jgi:glycosyltransferase involved in cell wall biosynthesis